MWEIDYHLIESWLDAQSPKTVAAIFAALELLEREGPSLGRPLVDIIQGSSVGNLKELRPASPKGSEIRIVFAFDPNRRAILLVAGDKARGKKKWIEWYKRAIPQAEALFWEHIESMARTR